MKVILRDRLAISSIDTACSYPLKYNEDMTGHDLDGWTIIDCRVLKDEPGNELDTYRQLVMLASEYLFHRHKIVCCCSAGLSRSPAIALGVLVMEYGLAYEDAYFLIDRICKPKIEPTHLSALQKIFKVCGLEVPLECRVKDL